MGCMQEQDSQKILVINTGGTISMVHSDKKDNKSTLILKRIFQDDESIKGLVLRTYGSENTPQNKEFLETIKYIIDMGVIILNVTQCTVGSVEMGLYESNAILTELGVVNGYDMTPEAAITKFMCLLGKYDVEKVKERLIENVAGELTK